MHLPKWFYICSPQSSGFLLIKILNEFSLNFQRPNNCLYSATSTQLSDNCIKLLTCIAFLKNDLCIYVSEKNNYRFCRKWSFQFQGIVIISLFFLNLLLSTCINDNHMKMHRLAVHFHRIQPLTQGQVSPQNGGFRSAYEAVDFLRFGDGSRYFQKYLPHIRQR